MLVIGWSQILTKELLSIPGLASINCHPSLLPKHRGFNPFSSVLRSGEKETGITYHLMDDRIDSGDILFQRAIPIDINDNGVTIQNKCGKLIVKTIVHLLKVITSQKVTSRPQDFSQASYFPKLKMADALIDWEQNSKKIHDQIRGVYPWLSAFSFHNKRRISFDYSRLIDVSPNSYSVGQIIEKGKDRLVLSTGNGAIRVQNIKISNWPLLAKRWYVSNRIKVGDILQGPF